MTTGNKKAGLDKPGMNASITRRDFINTNLRRQPLIEGDAAPLDPSKPTVLTFYVPYLNQGMPLPAQTIPGRNQLFASSYRDIEIQVRNQMQ